MSAVNRKGKVHWREAVTPLTLYCMKCMLKFVVLYKHTRISIHI